MRSLLSLPVSRSPRFGERSIVAPRNDKGAALAPTATAAGHQRLRDRLLAALLQALATPAV